VKQGKAGRYVKRSVGGEDYRAFIPDPLPSQYEINIDSELRILLDSALLALGRLDSLSTLLPDTALFLYMYIRKEAVLSSQIEGTQSSLSDLLLFECEEAPGVPLDDVNEVSNYVAAMLHGLKRLREGFPLSLRLIREIHKILLSKGRGSKKTPGEFRSSQNWIGGTRPGNAVYVPPPPEMLMDCLGDFEKFLHDQPAKTPLLIKAALAHVQFESIHPFLDGNGRLGRLLITFLLCAEKALTEPLLYLSLYFKTYKQQYYDLLQTVRIEGDWESWIRFFVEGVRDTCEKAVRTANELTEMFDDDRNKIQQIGRKAGSALQVHHELQRNPICAIKRIAKITGLTIPTVTSALEKLQDIGIVIEITGSKRGRLFAYDRYIKTLSVGTEPA